MYEHNTDVHVLLHHDVDNWLSVEIHKQDEHVLNASNLRFLNYPEREREKKLEHEQESGRFLKAMENHNPAKLI